MNTAMAVTGKMSAMDIQNQRPMATPRRGMASV